MNEMPHGSDGHTSKAPQHPRQPGWGSQREAILLSTGKGTVDGVCLHM